MNKEKLTRYPTCPYCNSEHIDGDPTLSSINAWYTQCDFCGKAFIVKFKEYVKCGYVTERIESSEQKYVE